MKKIVFDKSKEAFVKANISIPGGVDSPVRAFGSVGGSPVFIGRGSGSKIFDIDGNSYIDYVCSWGPLILGHADDHVINSIGNVLKKGTSFGAPTTLETTLAELIKKKFPSIEKVRMVSSGTEATMSAIRLARGYTEKDFVIKFNGCYHGHVDALLVQAGSGAMTFGTPTSPGVPQDYVKNTLVLPYNDIDAIKECCKKYSNKIACIIVEPVAGNMGVVPPKPGYLEKIREITEKENIVLIFDEIITGFRVSAGGAQELYGIKPDLTTLGKIIGGGMPVGAYGGKTDIMDKISPVGPVYQAGTLSGNPVAMAAGIATLERLSENGFYKKLNEKANVLAEGFSKAAKDAGVFTFHTKVGSILCTFFTDKEVTDFDSASSCDTEMYARYFHGMLERGFYFAPSQFEAAFVSSAHSMDDINATIEASKEVMKILSSKQVSETGIDLSETLDDLDNEIEDITKALSKMFYKTEEMLDLSINGFTKNRINFINDAERLGKEIYSEEEELESTIVNKAKLVESVKEQRYLMGLVSAGTHIKKIGDNVIDILGCIKIKVSDSMLFSEKAVDELDYLFLNTKDILKNTGDALVTKNKTLVKHILETESSLRQKACNFEIVHEERLISGVCVPKASSLYLSMVNSIRDVNWHIRQVLERLFFVE